jgi:hypothetical protein
MVEIKNIVNREITGIPSQAYWIQMQFQLEVCDLEACDFFETRFKEYDIGGGGGGGSVDQTLETMCADIHHAYRGVVLTWIPRLTLEMILSSSPETSAPPVHQFMPLDIELTSASINRWIETEKEKRPDQVCHEVQMWYLDEMSCVYVPRHRIWMEWALERVKGFAASLRVDAATNHTPQIL